MNFLIDNFLRKRTEDLTFIQLKEGTQLNASGYEVPEVGLYVPVLTAELANQIKTKKEDEVITVATIIRGIAYLLGVDPQFKHKEVYAEMLYGIDPNIEEKIIYEGIAYAGQNKWIESIISFKTVILLNEKNIKAMLNYAITLIKYAEESLQEKKQVYKIFRKEAKEKLEHILDIDDELALAYYHLGFLYRDEKAFVKAKIYWEKALLHQLDEALANQLREEFQQIGTQVTYEEGYEAILAGRPQEGLPKLIELEESYGAWWNLHFFIGLGYRQLGQFNDAVAYFEKVLDENEEQLDTVIELGLCFASLGKSHESIEYFQKALVLGEENSEVLCNLAMVYLEIGNIEEAKHHVERSLLLDPEDPVTQACQARIIELQ
ncbi:TPR repeat-containing protein [Alkaliphilus metalliredigens QYMF]|uniref:TPR repeat-containing protein n=1 Tax=Alkaliphilus metalliredigens (strain QYMF) TaxID=293826 RepID=A6TNY3_ALKMQ|nr:tetratricopeptide repeat protein [Alkaliphilus metalliredigens]ABR47901.1 TPR repeat-containing protein [Alkaliphilus metalliredigens QYMF]